MKKQISNKGTLLKQTKKTVKRHPIIFKSLSVSSEKITTNIVFGGIWSMLLGSHGYNNYFNTKSSNSYHGY